MKKILATVFLFVGLLGLSNPAHAFCLVLNEADSGSSTLRSSVEMSYNRDSNAACSTGPVNGQTTDSDPYDKWLGFNQAILINTPQARWNANFLVRKVTLTKSIEFKNPAQGKNVVVGMYSNKEGEVVYRPHPYTAAQKSDMANVKDYGLTTVDASSLASGQSPFACYASTNKVVLRSLVVITKGVSKKDLFDKNTCLYDGGRLYVCSSDKIDTTKTAEQAGWCTEATPVAPRCGDGIKNQPTEECDGTDGLDEAHTGATCTNECKYAPLVSERCGDSIINGTEACDDGNAVDTDSCHNDCTINTNPSCVVNGAEADNCSDGRDNDCDGSTDGDDVECKASVSEAGKCTNHVDDDGNGKTDCADDACKNTSDCTVPSTKEVNCSDKIDNDSNGKTDCDDDNCKTTDACKAKVEICDDAKDNDGDTKIDCSDTDCRGKGACTGPKNSDDDNDGLTENEGDCNDTTNLIGGNKSEKCDGLDNDCNTKLDESAECIQGDVTVDDDKDGFAEDEGDCDDNSKFVHPGLVGLCGCKPIAAAPTSKGLSISAAETGDTAVDNTIAINGPISAAEVCDPSVTPTPGQGGGGCGCDMSANSGSNMMNVMQLMAYISPVILMRLRRSFKNRK